MKAVLLAAGELKADSAWLEREVADAELLLAVDGGLRHALAAGLKPHLLLGDLDSVTEADLERVHGVQVMRFNADKDFTDLELAVQEARARGATRIVLAGALGARHDHGLANLLLAARLRREAVDVSLAGDGTLAWPLAAGDSLELPVPPGSTFSALALEPGCRVDLSGSLYELTGAELPFGSGLGISNVTGSATTVRVHSGLVLVLVVCDDV